MEMHSFGLSIVAQSLLCSYFINFERKSMENKSHKGLALRKTVVAQALFVAFGAVLATGAMTQAAFAQQTAGSISGKAAKGETIKVENTAINVTRQITVDESGSFQLTQLPSGTYKVTLTRANGKSETVNVQVSAGQGATATFAESLAAVTITGTSAKSIDMSAVTSGFSVSKASIDRLPVAKDVTSVALLAPGAVKGDGRFGNLASLGGASPAENAYYINGFNVTNIVKGVAFNAVPFDATAEQQVLSSGYSVEFGRSLGGVISVNTKRGTNEWKGGVSVDYTPSNLRGSSVYAKKSTTGSWDLVERPSKNDSLITSAYVGGPVIEDKLYFFGLVRGQKRDIETYGQDTSTVASITSPSYLVKLDWNLTSNNLIELTAFDDKSTTETRNFAAASPYTSQLGKEAGSDSETSGGRNIVGKWTSYITPDLTMSTLYGVGKYSRSNIVGGASCPAVYDGTSGTLKYLGCWSEAFLQVENPTNGDERKAFRLDLEWNLGKHQIRGGLDREVYTTEDGAIYSGGTYYRVYPGVAPGRGISGTGYVNNTSANIPYVRVRNYKNGGTFKTENSAWYLEDNYKPSKDITVNFGVRAESFTNFNDVGQAFIDVKNTIAPRGGVSWDVNGDGQTKAYGSAGRYFIPVYANTNARLAGVELFTQDYYRFNGTFSSDGKSVPGLGEKLGNTDVLSDGLPRNPATLVDTGLQPMFQDEVVLGFQRAIGNRWVVGAKYTNRNLKNAMDDYGDGTLAGKWALEKGGYTAAQAAAIQDRVDGYVLMNVGKDLNINVDINSDGKLSKVSIPASALLSPEVKRTYNAIELMAERPWDGQWSFQGSYVLAFNEGNTEGYVKSDIGQDDAGITQDWDHPSWMEGSAGYLPNDRRHTIKLNGAYALNSEWRIGGTATFQSGRPKNCFGVYNGTIVDGGSGPNSFYCNGVLTPRGSLGRLDWNRDISLSATYSPKAIKGLSLTANVLNIFNERTVGAVDEAGEDTAGAANPNFQRPVLAGVQGARAVRLNATYEF
jgi:hypothetical protein